MQLMITGLTVLFALAYFGFYGIRIGELPFWAILAIGLVFVLIEAVQDVREARRDQV